VLGFRDYRDFARAASEGRTLRASFLKLPAASTITTSGWWVDLSMVGRQPVAQYYAAAPLLAAQLNGMEGIFRGVDPLDGEKRLSRWWLVSPTAAFVCRFMLCDYLLFYPFVDGDSTDEQPTDNTVTLPRYTDGDGVMVMAVGQATTTGGGTFTFSYVDHDGNAQTSPVNTFSTTAANPASILTSQPATLGGGPFCRLASGSRGVRSITSITNVSAPGGLFALVLVRPLADIAIRELSTPNEISLVELNAAPRIYDGAYLNLLANVQGSIASGLLMGHAVFNWSD